jgi:hypothetical protein
MVLGLIVVMPLSKAVLSKVTLPIARLSKAGMPSRSGGWGGLFKDEQYRLIILDSSALLTVPAIDDLSKS